MTNGTGGTLFWHRRDLRIEDNIGISTAAEEGQLLPVFCLDPNVLEYAGPPRVAFLIDALTDLRDRYREYGTDLLVVEGDPVRQIPAIAVENGVGLVVWNADYSGLARERDQAVSEALQSKGIEVTETHDAALHRPGSIRTNDGDPYSAFSYYWEKWNARDHEPSPSVPKSDVFTAVEGESIPSLQDLGFSPVGASIPVASRVAARERLSSFLDGPVFEYADCRDVPAATCTSRLSQDLKFGLLGIREVYAATEAAADRASTPEERESVQEYQRQLAWRDFYMQVLAFNPETVTEDFKSFQNAIEWNQDEEQLQAWKRGETGYPIVDAGMRQLLAEGFVHNRVRMIVASFLTKDLLVNWREGYRWFRERLVDHDTANDVGGWQWAASTGTDSQPYFRVFNPMTQGERYDPDAKYINEYVEELREVAPETIHRWTELDADERRENAPSYPPPIVDHSSRRERAIATFERAKGND